MDSLDEIISGVRAVIEHAKFNNEYSFELELILKLAHHIKRIDDQLNAKAEIVECEVKSLPSVKVRQHG